jgi:hypothetical protein
MKKVFLTVIVILALSFSFVCLVELDKAAWAAPGDSESDPIIITTAEGLDNIRSGLSKFYQLGNNIDMYDFLCPT